MLLVTKDSWRPDRKRIKSRRSGQAAIFVTLSLPVLFGMLGMVVDIGWDYWRSEACKTAAQSAASAAGIAAKAASNLTCASGVACTASATTFADCPASPTSPPTNNIMNGCLYAQANGFTTGGNGSRQRVQYAAYTSGSPVAGSAPSYWVEFVVYEKIPALFLSVLGTSWTQVSAASTSGVFSGNPGCVYILDATAQKALTVTGGTFTTGCGMYVNSNQSNAFFLTGGTVNLTGTAAINVHGLESTSGGTVSPNHVLTNQGSVSDPLSGLTAPTPALPCTPFADLTSGSQTINNGTYCSIAVKGGSLKLNAGTYIITGGDFKNSGGTVDATSGVTIYFPSTSGNLNVTSGNTFALTAPSSGTYNGIAVWKDGSSSSLNSATFTAGLTINGVIYMPYTKLTYTGGTTPVSETIVVDTLNLTGGNITQPATSTYITGAGAITFTSLLQ
jgi:hypothetical protein